MLIAGLLCIVLGLVFGLGILVIVGIVLLVLGLCSGATGYGWWYPRGRRGPYV